MVDKKAKVQVKKRWEKPQGDILKVNCDAAFHRDSGSGGWGFIVRDSDGDVVMAGRGRIDHVMDPFQAELISCLQLQGVQAAAELW